MPEQHPLPGRGAARHPRRRTHRRRETHCRPRALARRSPRRAARLRSAWRRCWGAEWCPWAWGNFRGRSIPRDHLPRSGRANPWLLWPLLYESLGVLQRLATELW